MFINYSNFSDIVVIIITCVSITNKKLVLVLFNDFGNIVSTRNSTQKLSPIFTRKVGTVDCFMKDLPSYWWCSNCSQSSNRAPTEKVKPCCQPWVFKDNSHFSEEKIIFNSRLSYF